MKTKLLLFFTLFSSQFLVSRAQSPNPNWAHSFGSSNVEHINSTAIDAAGNVYTCGSFFNTIDFDPGVSIHNLVSNGGNDSFILKLDSAGNYVWALSFGGSIYDEPFDISIDENGSGDLFITGSYAGTVDFDPGAGQKIYTSAAGSRDIFILRLTSNGDFVWAKSIGGTLIEFASSIAVSSSGNEDVYISGWFESDSIDFDPGAAVSNLYSGGIGYGNSYVLKLDSEGNFVWVKQFGGTGYSGIQSLALDNQDNIYSTGGYTSVLDCDPGPLTYNLQSNGDGDIFVSKLDKDGNFLWGKSIGGISIDYSSTITIDKAGNNAVYLGGGFNNSVDFDPGLGNHTVNSAGMTDIFILKLDSLGNFDWVRNIGAAGAEAASSICVEPFGNRNVYVGGNFILSVDFDPGPAVYNLTCNLYTAGFVSKFDPSGNFISAFALDGSGYDGVLTLSTFPNGNLCVGGIYTSQPLIFGSTTLVNQGNEDIFIANIGPSLTTGISSNGANGTELNLYPNPAQNQVHLNFETLQKNLKIELRDLYGKLIYEGVYAEQKNINLNCESFSDGIYFLTVQTNNQIQTTKISLIR